MALVPYNPPTILQQFHESQRTFIFQDKSLTVYQNWNDFGVAAVVWDAAIILGRYLEKLGTSHFHGKKVIELGAGTALVGMVASLLGADVTVTDRESALDITTTNIERNFGRESGIKIQELEWGKTVDKDFPTPYDFVLGADVVYIEETFKDLIKTLNDLCDENTSVLLSARIRYERDNHFLKLLSESFSWAHILHDEELGIEIFKATKKKLWNPSCCNWYN